MAYAIEGDAAPIAIGAGEIARMTISLVEEFLLLALEDEGGQFSRIPETSLSCGLAGAALIDLEIRGKIATGSEGLWVVDTGPTGSPILDALLADIAAESDRVEVEMACPTSQTVRVAVRDWGPGIAPEHRPHVFDRLYQAHAATRHSGMGLGLHICRVIVERHGGRVWAESPGEGHGTTLWVALPLAAVAASA